MREITKIIIYGAGIRGKRLCKALWESGSEIEVAAVVDGNSRLWGRQYYGYTVSDPATVLKDIKVPVCITAADENAVHDITKLLVNRYQIDMEDIIGYISLLLKIWEDRARVLSGQVSDPEDAESREANVIFDFASGLILGGGEAWVKELCLGLLKRNLRNIRICANERRIPGYVYPAEWEELLSCIDFLGNDPKTQLENRPVFDTLQYLMEKRPCVVVATYLETLCVACALKSLYPAQVRIIATIHIGYEGMYRNYAALKEKVDAYVAVSRDIQQGIMRQGVKKERVLLMEIPFSCEKEIDRFYTEDCSKQIRLGYAGRLQIQQKRMDLLTKLIQALKERKVSFELEIAGAGDYEDTMRRFVMEHHLEEQVHFVGRLPREEIPAFWKRQDICVNISDFEGRSISITEAMGNGAVPVVTDVSGVRDDIVDGVNGFIVPVGDIQAMADRIEYLAEHRERLRPMGLAAHDEVYPKSSEKQHIQFWEALLAEEIAALQGRQTEERPRTGSDGTRPF